MSQHYTTTATIKLIADEYRSAIALGIERGWISKPRTIEEMDAAIEEAARDKMRESAVICYHRSKAERNGEPLDSFHPRQRRKHRKNKVAESVGNG
jgi:hypothetical protein